MHIFVDFPLEILSSYPVPPKMNPKPSLSLNPRYNDGFCGCPTYRFGRHDALAAAPEALALFSSSWAHAAPFFLM